MKAKNQLEPLEFQVLRIPHKKFDAATKTIIKAVISNVLTKAS